MTENIRNGFRIVVSLAVSVFVVKKVYNILNNTSNHNNSLTKLPPQTRGIESLVGNTPIIEIKSLSKLTGCKIYAKLELENPGGSAKDRVALSIIRKNEALGKLKPNHGDIIFEGTSGSTGISFALLSNALGYETHICLPDDTADEKMKLLESLGAYIEPVRPASIVDPEQYVNAAKSRAQAINDNDKDSRNAIFADQFENDYNWRIHYDTTGPEIWQQMNKIDYFITGAGTGGTIAGVGRYLKEMDPKIKVILGDPQGSGLANRINYGVMYDGVEKEGTRRRHQIDTIIEGIGLNRLTWNFQQAEPYIDYGIKVSDEKAIKMAKYLCVNDGLFWGSSAAINCVAAVETALAVGPGKSIVIIACDSGSRHLSKFWKQARQVSNDITLHDIV